MVIVVPVGEEVGEHAADLVMAGEHDPGCLDGQCPVLGEVLQDGGEVVPVDGPEYGAGIAASCSRSVSVPRFHGLVSFLSLPGAY